MPLTVLKVGTMGTLRNVEGIPRDKGGQGRRQSWVRLITSGETGSRVRVEGERGHHSAPQLLQLNPSLNTDVVMH